MKGESTAVEIADGDGIRARVNHDACAGHVEAHGGAVAGGDGVIAGEREQVDCFLRRHRHVERGEQCATRCDRESGQ